MQIGIIKRYGIFNSKNRSSENSTRFRVSSTFELEYVISASTSTHFNGKRYELSPNSFIIVKPNQKRVTLNNFKCYYIHLDLSQENEFFELLKNLPDYVLLINPEQCKTTMKELISHLITHGYDPQCEFVNAKLLELFYHLKMIHCISSSAFRLSFGCFVLFPWNGYIITKENERKRRKIIRKP